MRWLRRALAGLWLAVLLPGPALAAADVGLQVLDQVLLGADAQRLEAGLADVDVADAAETQTPDEETRRDAPTAAEDAPVRLPAVPETLDHHAALLRKIARGAEAKRLAAGAPLIGGSPKA